jgi:hypothetical protein
MATEAHRRPQPSPPLFACRHPSAGAKLPSRPQPDGRRVLALAPTTLSGYPPQPALNRHGGRPARRVAAKPACFQLTHDRSAANLLTCTRPPRHTSPMRGRTVPGPQPFGSLKAGVSRSSWRSLGKFADPRCRHSRHLDGFRVQSADERRRNLAVKKPGCEKAIRHLNRQ